MLQTLGGSSLTIIMLICVLYLSWYSILWFHDNIVTLSNPIWYQHWRWPCWGHDTSTLFFMNYRWWYLFLWEVLLLQAGWGGLCKWLDDGGVPDIVAPRSHELAHLETSISEDLPWGTQGQVWHHWYAVSEGQLICNSVLLSDGRWVQSIARMKWCVDHLTTKALGY